MHYFTHGTNIAAVESPEQAEKYRAAGWQPITRDAYIRAWRRRDMAQLQRMLIEAYYRQRRMMAATPGLPWHGL